MVRVDGIRWHQIRHLTYTLRAAYDLGMEKLLEYLNAERGRRAKLAEALGISSAATSQWKEVPLDRVIQIEALTGISRYELRPDVFAVPVPAPVAQPKVSR
jgi:hypothetical protein